MPLGGVTDSNELPVACGAIEMGVAEKTRVQPAGELGVVEPKLKLRELQPAVSLLRILAVYTRVTPLLPLCVAGLSVTVGTARVQASTVKATALLVPVPEATLLAVAAKLKAPATAEPATPTVMLLVVLPPGASTTVAGLKLADHPEGIVPAMVNVAGSHSGASLLVTVAVKVAVDPAPPLELKGVTVTVGAARRQLFTK
jgi:hypothetical protein